MSKIAIIFITLCTASCSMLGSERVRHSKTTSLVGFLYPNGEIPPDKKSPTLHLPLRVGLAYIPESGNRGHIDPRLKLELLNTVKHQFENRRYVHSIQIIPDNYLSGPNSKNQLKQIKQLYQLDVMALVSYDQIVNRKENLLALTYLTIVGNYIFPGSHFDVSTLIDMALIDLESKRLLFRAAGTHGSKGTAAEAYTRHRYDKHQNNDFSAAMSKLQVNLNHELHNFETRLRAKDPNDDIKVVARQGYEMSINRGLLLFLLFAALTKISVHSIRRTVNIKHP
ncbi:MAG: rhombotarget lipoprotein [Marinicella sp.]